MMSVYLLFFYWYVKYYSVANFRFVNLEKWIVMKNELRQKQMDEKSGVASAFAFDHVFDKSVKTIELYNTIVAPIVHDSLKGFNGTILCYGQTSSGKWIG